MQDHRSAATGPLPASDGAAEDASTREVRKRQRETWLKENRDAIKAYNEDVAQHGVFSSGLRGF